MSANNNVRFFDTSGCLNLSRPTNGTRNLITKRPVSSSIPIRGQVKIDLFNFDHIDFVDSKYVLTSPRSLEACARLNVKPLSLLPRKLDDIKTDKVRFSTLCDVRDEMELDRLGLLQRCREEREKIIREETIEKSTKLSEPKSSSHKDTRGTLTTPTRLRSTIPIKSFQTSTSLTRPTFTKSSNDINELHTSSSGTFLDDIRRMDKSLQRIGTAKSNKNENYVNGLENVKQMIEQHGTQITSNDDIENATLEKKQHELLLSHYDHELKIQRARENARRTEKEKETERYDSLMHDFLDQSMAEERRKNELRRKLDKIHQSRQLYETLQSKNHEIQMADVQKRRLELLNEIKRKDRRTEHFVKDKQNTANLSRTIAKSSQDTREYIRETNETFDQKAKRAELMSSILITKANIPTDQRHLQSSIRT